MDPANRKLMQVTIEDARTGRAAGHHPDGRQGGAPPGVHQSSMPTSTGRTALTTLTDSLEEGGKRMVSRKDDKTPIARGEHRYPCPWRRSCTIRMIPYAEHVIMERAMPRVEDGLKPVQRRILYHHARTGHHPGQAPYRKCARIVGDCLGKYHPHGDSSVYDALVRMAQDFSMRGHAGGRPRQLRLRGRRQRRRHALHRGPHDPAGHAHAAGHRQGHRALPPEL